MPYTRHDENCNPVPQEEIGRYQRHDEECNPVPPEEIEFYTRYDRYCNIAPKQPGYTEVYDYWGLTRRHYSAGYIRHDENGNPVAPQAGTISLVAWANPRNDEWGSDTGSMDSEPITFNHADFEDTDSILVIYGHGGWYGGSYDGDGASLGLYVDQNMNPNFEGQEVHADVKEVLRDEGGYISAVEYPGTIFAGSGSSTLYVGERFGFVYRHQGVAVFKITNREAATRRITSRFSPIAIGGKLTEVSVDMSAPTAVLAGAIWQDSDFSGVGPEVLIDGVADPTAPIFITTPNSGWGEGNYILIEESLEKEFQLAMRNNETGGSGTTDNEIFAVTYDWG